MFAELEMISNDFLEYGNPIVKTNDGKEIELKRGFKVLKTNDRYTEQVKMDTQVGLYTLQLQNPMIAHSRPVNPTESVRKVMDGVESYLYSELELLDSKAYESITEYYHQSHMPLKTGGGFVEGSSFLKYDYQDTPEGGGYISGATNVLETVSVGTAKEFMPARTWARKVSIGYVDLIQSLMLNRSLEALNEKAVYRAYYTELDKVAFLGWDDIEDPKPGLYNNSDINSSTYTNGGWAALAGASTADPILQDVNEGIVETVGASERFPKELIPNLLLISPATLGTLVSNKVSDAGNVSIYQFLIDNNYAKANGVNFRIEANPYSVGTGVGSTERHVYYQDNEETVRMRILVSLNRLESRFSANDMQYHTPYVAHFTAPEFIYISKLRYKDGA